MPATPGPRGPFNPQSPGLPRNKQQLDPEGLALIEYLLFVVLSGGVAGAKYPTVAAAQAAGATTMNIGLFLNSIVSFLMTMFAVFLIVRAVAKMRDKKAATTRACSYCKSMINIAACKCPNCCSDVEPVAAQPDQESELKKGIKNLTKVANSVANSSVAKIKKISKR